MKRSTKGSAIIMVLLVLLVLSVLGITLLSMDMVHMKILSSDKLYQSAYYYAEAGLTQQVEILCNNMELLYKDPEIIDRDLFLMRLLATAVKTPKFEEFIGEEIDIKITCMYNGRVSDKDELVMVSTCNIGNVKRSVKAVIHIQWVDPNMPDFKIDDTCFYIAEWGENR